jgi:hypothetical protein
VRPLAGGLEAWREHGLRMEAAPEHSRHA